MKSVANLLKVLTYSSGHSEEAEKQQELYQAIDEYFRLKFRKLSGRDAVELLIPLGEDPTKKLTALDDKFWVWETIDEAVRPIVSDLTDEEVIKVSKALAANYKGSDDLWDFLIQKVHFYGAKPF